jgi:hypothetical protein
MSDVAVIVIALALGVNGLAALVVFGLMRLEYRLVIKGRDITVTTTDVRAVIAGSDAPQAAITPHGAVPAELASRPWSELEPPSLGWHAMSARELERRRR